MNFRFPERARRQGWMTLRGLWLLFVTGDTGHWSPAQRWIDLG